MTIFRRVSFRLRNVSDKSCGEILNTNCMFKHFFPENRAVYDTMWKNVIQTGHRREYGAEHVTIIAFPLQLCRKRASTLRYTYTACLVKLSFPRHYYTHN